MPQPQPRQQSRLSDIQMLQRQIMMKQLQEMQRQQQFQGLGDAKQQNYINQELMINKQASGAQFPHLINGTPIHDASQMLMVGNMNLVQHGASPLVQGFSNGLGFSQAQSQALRSMGLVSQQLDASFYGTPIISAGNNLSQYSHLQGASHDSANLLTKGNNNQAEKPLMQPSAFSNSFMSDRCTVASSQASIPDGAFVSKQELQEKNFFGKAPTEGLNNGVQPGNFQHVNTLQRNASVQEFGGRQEQASWPGLFPGKTAEIGPSQGLASLDPLEQKILFNMDENSWEASFGRRSNMGIEGFETTLEHTDHLSTFPSVQSGSWSALMQSAVAEASSSDTGLQEEWSGSSFQNPELSTNNQTSNFVDSGKKHTNLVDNNLQGASSLSSKPELLFNNPHSSSSPGFQQSTIQFSLKQKDGMRMDSSHESIQQSPKNASKWLDGNPQQKQSIEGLHPVQRHSPLQSAWPGQNYVHSESGAHRQSKSSHTHGCQPCNNLTGDINGAGYKDPKSLWKTDNDHVAGSFYSDGGLEQLKSGKFNTVADKDDSQLNHFIAVPKASTTRVDQETSRHVLESNQLDYMKRVDISVRDRENENMGNDQLHSIPSQNKGASESYVKEENCFLTENSIGSYHSNASQHTITGHELREDLWLRESDSHPVAEGNEKPSVQVLRQQVPRGMSDLERGYVGQFKFIGNVSNSGMDFEKGYFPDIQRNFRASEEVPHTGNIGSNISAFFDGSAGFDTPEVTAQTSHHLLELIYKVDKSTEYRSGMHFGSTDSIPLSEVPQAETCDASVTKSYNKSSASQCFGLRLAPPSQRLPDSNCFDASQSSPKKGNSTATFSPYEINQLENQNQSAAHVEYESPQATLPGIGRRFTDFDRVTSQDTSVLICANPYGQEFPILEARPVTQPSVTSGMSQQTGFSMRSPNVWKNVSTQQNLSGTEPRRVPFSLLPSPDSTNCSQETASGAPEELQNQNYFRRGNNSQEIAACSINSQGSRYVREQPGKEWSGQQISSEILDPVSQPGKLSLAQESLAKRLSEANAVASSLSMTSSRQQDFDRAWHSDYQARGISTRDIEAFGRSLKPSHAPLQNYLLHQVHSTKNVETDPSESLDSEARDRSVKASSQPLLQDTPQEMVTDSRSHSISSNAASSRTERSPISLQVAPSWYKNYGTLKNGQMLPMYDARDTKNAAQQFFLGKPFENLHMNNSIVRINSAVASQFSSVWPSTASTSVAVKQFSPPYVWPSDITNQNLAVLRSKKRKIAVTELLPWYKEVTQGSDRLQNFSMAELEWAQAVNRLIEKMEDEVEMNESMLPMLRPKKRLLLTTQLMQQVFRPAPAVILSEDATSNWDGMAYFAARLALGDACSLTSNSHMPCDVSDMSSAKHTTSERIGERDFSKIVEHFINQSKRLESDLLSLDKRVSILDIRVESQELERFSVINRFAKFHGRGHPGAADSSTSSGTTPTMLKMYPQRYVTALPMPRTVPEGAQCLSL